MIFQDLDRIVFAGDSITDMGSNKPVGEGLFNAWGRSYVANVGSLLGCMYPELQLRIVNMGISGNQVRDLAARWQNDVINLQPDWVSILIGINDVWRQFDEPAMYGESYSPEVYRKNIEAVCERTVGKVKKLFDISPFYMQASVKRELKNMDQSSHKLRELH